MEQKKYNIHAFDFDGTLTKRDSFLEFIAFALGRKTLFKALLLHLPALLLMKLGLRDNGEVKQSVFAYCFQGMPSERFHGLCKRFAAERRTILRPAAVDYIRRLLLKEGNYVVIVSASPEAWVREFFSETDQIEVTGTVLEEKDGRITGRFASKNCYGMEKVVRLKRFIGAATDFRLTAYGDSRGDMEMLDFADEGHYKPFRR